MCCRCSANVYKGDTFCDVMFHAHQQPFSKRIHSTSIVDPFPDEKQNNLDRVVSSDTLFITLTHLCRVVSSISTLSTGPFSI